MHEIVAKADVVINNLRGDQPEKLGLDFQALAPLNPAIVCGHISAYGRNNNRSGRPGYDFLMQAEAGLMSLTGDHDGEPTRFGPSMIDFMTGMTLAVGILAAVINARKTGEGCDVDTTLFDVALHQLNYAATWYLNREYEVKRLPRSAHFSAVPVQTFRAADGWMFVMCMTEKFWGLLADEIGRSDLRHDPKFATLDARAQNRASLTEILDHEFCRDTVDAWVERLGFKIPISPVYDIAQALDSPFVREVGMVVDVPHPEMSGMRLLANPLRINGKRPTSKACEALGASNEVEFGTMAGQ